MQLQNLSKRICRWVGASALIIWLSVLTYKISSFQRTIIVTENNAVDYVDSLKTLSPSLVEIGVIPNDCEIIYNGIDYKFKYGSYVSMFTYETAEEAREVLLSLIQEKLKDDLYPYKPITKNR